MSIFLVTAQSSGYIMSNKFRSVNFPKRTLLRVFLVHRITISKICFLKYLAPQQKSSSLFSNTNIWTTHLEYFVSFSQYVRDSDQF
jgi:hypothetical protein